MTRQLVEAQMCPDVQTQRAMNFQAGWVKRINERHLAHTSSGATSERHSIRRILTCRLRTDATPPRGSHTSTSGGRANVFLSTPPTSSWRLSSFTWAVSCDKSSLWEASARTLTVVSASWSHFRKVSSSLRDICSPFSSLSRWA